MGFPFFVPVYQENTRIRIHGRPFRFRSYHEILKGVMCNPYCPVDFEDTKASFEFNNIGDKPFAIGSLSIRSIMLSHPNGGLGFRFEEDGVSFVFLTDNELDYVHPDGRTVEEYTAFSQGADLLIHDAEYTSEDYSRAWGHSVFESAVKMGIAAKVKQFGLFHINQRRTDDEMDAMVEKSCAMVAEAGSDMECFAVSNMWEAQLG
jgi:phosphoribosyl 1,2-cyclic phosphodiesterase